MYLMLLNANLKFVRRFQVVLLFVDRAHFSVSLPGEILKAVAIYNQHTTLRNARRSTNLTIIYLLFQRFPLVCRIHLQYVSAAREWKLDAI